MTMEKCGICGKPKGADLFSAVTNDGVCSICKIKFIGGLPTTTERVNNARVRLGLSDGEYLEQDNAKEASRILGRK